MEIRNAADSLIYTTEKSLREVGDRLDPSVRNEVESALAELKRVAENGTATEVKSATDKLQQAAYRMSEALYQTAARDNPVMVHRPVTGGPQPARQAAGREMADRTT